MSSYVEINIDQYDQTAPNTIVVLGPPRSGTSMISGILRLLGIYMGECTNTNNEDPRFNKRQSVESIRELIGSNNQDYPQQWGWKQPSTYLYYDKVADVVRAPIFIVSYRNILASSASKLKHTDTGDIGRLVGGYARNYLRIAKLLKEHDGPRILVNYEKVLEDPIALGEALSKRLLGKDLSPEVRGKLEAYCAPGSYKPIEDYL
ncbi:hypothetical protein [Planktotalea sp.]|uniref:hypothetical protein n=1 Tax=Planktotalea sp. TaxID=2029877 RepID=UPI00329934D1